MERQKIARVLAAILAGLLPAVVSFGSEAYSLAGDWACRLDPKKEGVAQAWFNADLPQRIKLPGSTDEAKLGVPNTKAPSLYGLYRLNTYAGPAWYQREIEVPAAWEGKRIALFLERAHWETRVWVDGQGIGKAQDSLVTPHVHDLGILSPGKHRLTICVDNTLKYDMGFISSIHTEHTQGNWNGIIGSIELQPKEAVHLADIQVYPNAAERKIRVVAKLANTSEKEGCGRLSVEVTETGGMKLADKVVDAVWEAKDGGKVELELPFGQQAKLWDEFQPNLYILKAALTTSEGLVSTRQARFGLRDFAIDGRQFTLNGRVIRLRGEVECGIFPLTGYTAMDKSNWQRIMKVLKAYGLNHLRFHSWTPPEEAFAAADEAGIIFLVEVPQANIPQGGNPARDAFIAEEAFRIQDAYGNHPSFCMLTMGNELPNFEVLTKVVEEAKRRDGRQVCSPVTMSFGRHIDVAQFDVCTPRGFKSEGTLADFEQMLLREKRFWPVIAHEVGQWQVFPNFREMEKYTGVFEPRNFGIIREQLEKKGMLDQAGQFFQATGKHAAVMYKEEIEVLLRTAGSAGFDLLSLHDYPGQGTATVGVLDPFWDSKGVITPEAFRRFCGPTVLLLRFAKRSWSSEETFKAGVEIAHFGEADLNQATPVWSVKDEQGKEIATGTLPTVAVKTGTVSKLGDFAVPLGAVKTPCKLAVTLSINGTSIANDWELWVYSAPTKPETPAGIVVRQQWDETARRAAANGGKVLLLIDHRGPSLLNGSFKGVFWSPLCYGPKETMSILCDPKHPALAGFPTEFYTNWQWYDLLNNSSVMVMDELPKPLHPIVQVIDNVKLNRKLGNLFEAKVGSGRVLVCTIDLQNKMEKRPAASQLLRSLLAYMESDKFQPTQTLENALLARLSAPHRNRLKELGAKILAVDSEQKDHPASMLLDADPATYWATVPAKAGTGAKDLFDIETQKWVKQGASAGAAAHEISFDLGREIEVQGCALMPLPFGSRKGHINEYVIQASANGTNWGEPVFVGALPTELDRQSIRFEKPVTTRYIKLVVRSILDRQDHATLAEFDLVAD